MDNGYPFVPSPGHTDTSADGAAKIAPAAGAIRDQVADWIAYQGRYGSTVIEFCNRFGVDRFGAQPRFSELRKQRLIADSGQRRKNPSGVNAIVWVSREVLDNG